MSSREWAAWALLGDDSARVPKVLQEIHERIAQAIRQAIAEDRNSRRVEVKGANKCLIMPMEEIKA